MTPSRENTLMCAALVRRARSTSGRRVGRQTPDAHSALEDAVQDEQELLQRPIRHRPLGGRFGLPALALLTANALDRRTTEGRVQATDHLPVVVKGGWL